MTNTFYAASSGLIAALLFVTVLLFMEGGYRFGWRQQALSSGPMTSQFLALQGSLLGLISLLLGFTFSIALHHFDGRSEAMLEEANAIGTAYLRAQSLPDTVRNETLATLGKYLQVRVQSNKTSLADELHHEPLARQAGELRLKLWDLAMKSIKADDRVTTTGHYIQALDGLIDSYSSRDEILNRHVPEVVIFLLFVTIILAGGVLGYTSGVAGHRPTMATIAFMVIVVVLVSMIMDLDRPRRGYIQVSQKSMLDLQEEINGSR